MRSDAVNTLVRREGGWFSGEGRIRTETRLRATPGEVFAWHASPGAFEALNPPWSGARLLTLDRGLEEGSLWRFRVGWGPAGRLWEARIRDVEPGRSFTDIQERGPFASWCHRHEFLPDGEGTRMCDDVVWRLPWAPVTGWVAGWIVRAFLVRMFRYRHGRLLERFGVSGP